MMTLHLFVQVLLGPNNSYDYYGDSDLETCEESVSRSEVNYYFMVSLFLWSCMTCI